MEYKVVIAELQELAPGVNAEVIRYEKPDGSVHVHAIPEQCLENWMVETDFEGTPKQALPKMLNEFLDMLKEQDGEEPQVVLPKDSNHPVHAIHKKVSTIRVMNARASRKPSSHTT